MVNNAYLLMLKQVYPFARNTSKVLSNCVVKVGGHDLESNVTQCTLPITRYI